MPAMPARSEAKRILIVEDDELNRKFLHDLLEIHGYRTITAEEGNVVLRLARENRPDLILMDLQLPDVSGFDTVRQLKGEAETRAIPIVAVTAFAQIGDDRKALASGCDGYVAKPIMLHPFLAMVKRFLGTSGDKLR